MSGFFGGSGGGSAVSSLLDMQYSTSVLTGNSADQTVLSYTLPASRMAASKGIRVTARFLQVGTTATTYKLKFGGTTVWAAATTSASNGLATISLFNQPGVTNAQVVLGSASVISSAVLNAATIADSAIDTTSPVVVLFTFNVDATVTLTKYGWAVEAVG